MTVLRLANSVRRMMWSVLGLALLCAAAMAGADGASRTESALKAEFIYNFARFVSWPRSAISSGAIVFCIGGNRDFSAVFKNETSGRRIGQLAIDVLDVEEGDYTQPCNVLYIPHAKSDLADKYLHGYLGKPVLSVGETPDFIAKGGVIGFYQDNGRLRFEIGLATAGENGLTISSELLSLARVHR